MDLKNPNEIPPKLSCIGKNTQVSVVLTILKHIKNMIHLYVRQINPPEASYHMLI
jgi:hypothetical protein